MSAWTVVPCLLALRAEFDRVNPGRDRGADGTIGDSAHTSTSDHSPDEDSDVLRDHDADSKNEVHALDIDSSGPWPHAGWFNDQVLSLVAREKAEYESPDVFGRLSYVIWNRRIASRSQGWVWRSYAGADPHENHAHFSARYTTAQESDTRPWGVQEDIVTKDEIAAVAAAVAALLEPRLSKLETADATQITAIRQTAASVLQVRQALDALAANPGGVSAEQIAELTAGKLAARLQS